MLAFFHGDGREILIFFGLVFGVPTAIAFFLLYRWKANGRLSILKGILVLVTSIIMVASLIMFMIGFGF